MCGVENQELRGMNAEVLGPECDKLGLECDMRATASLGPAHILAHCRQAVAHREFIASVAETSLTAVGGREPVEAYRVQTSTPTMR